MSQFEREDRYIVLKRKHLSDLPSELQMRLKLALKDAAALLPKMDCVVVESDWPEFEPTWAAIERRMTGAPAWAGVGLPPVGTVCEYKRPGGWVKVEVFAVKPNSGASSSALFTLEDGTWRACAEPYFFRRCRTPEQIAAEEREKAIAEMAETMRRATGFGINLADAAALYDAGYRKQVAP